MARPLRVLFQSLKEHALRRQSWMITYLQRFLNLFSIRE